MISGEGSGTPLQYSCLGIPWTEDPGGLQSMGSLRVGHDWATSGSSVHGILQTRILEWIAMPSSRGSSGPRDRTHNSHVSCIGRQVLYH